MEHACPAVFLVYSDLDSGGLGSGFGARADSRLRGSCRSRPSAGGSASPAARSAAHSLETRAARFQRLIA